MIALALACKPELIIGDEPTTALDVMMQAQILELLEELRRELGLAMILITHDLSVLAETCDRVAIMYAGQIAEVGPSATCTPPAAPVHAAAAGRVPRLGGPRELAPAIPGVPPDPAEQPPGCRFAPRCHRVAERCVAEAPELRPLADDRLVRCHFAPWPAGAYGMSAVTPRSPRRCSRCATSKVHFPIHRFRRGRVVEGHRRRRPRCGRRGETLGIVGESGCGKSTLGAHPARLAAGRRRARSWSTAKPLADSADLRAVRRRVQMIFQDRTSR